MKKQNKIVGYVDESLTAHHQDLERQKGKAIVQNPRLHFHTVKHREEFVNYASYYSTMKKIKTVINDPYYVYYDKEKSSLRFYKKLKDYVCAVVRLTNKRNLFVVTVYPVSKKTIEKYRRNNPALAW